MYKAISALQKLTPCIKYCLWVLTILCDQDAYFLIHTVPDPEGRPSGGGGEDLEGADPEGNSLGTFPIERENPIFINFSP